MNFAFFEFFEFKKELLFCVVLLTVQVKICLIVDIEQL